MDGLKKPEKEISLDGINIEEEAKGAIAGATPETTAGFVRSEEAKEQLEKMSDEPKVYLGGKTTQEQFVASKLNVKSSGSGRLLLAVLGGLLLVGALVLAVWSFAEKEKATDELATTQSQLATLQNQKREVADTDKSDKDLPVEPVVFSAEDAIKQAADNYGCLFTADVNTCDKATAKVSRKQEASADKSGFAIAHLMSGDNADKVVLRMLLKEHNSEWVVIYDGQGPVAEDVIKKFSVPTEYQEL